MMGLKHTDVRVTWQWKQMRKRVLIRDGYVCSYCGQDATTVDHVIAVSVDASQSMNIDNLVACCVRCNSSKGNRGVFPNGKVYPLVLPGVLSLVTTTSLPESPFEPLNQSKEV